MIAAEAKCFEIAIKTKPPKNVLQKMRENDFN